MTGFAAAWLALREPVDARARRRETGPALRRRLGEDRLEVIDLGAGTGANLRFLAPLLGGVQRWTLVDNDGALIAAQVEAFAHWAPGVGARLTRSRAGLVLEADGFTCEVTNAVLDLDADLDRLPVPAGGLVTASALLDLVSAAWLARLVERVAVAGAVCAFALNYDGRIELSPPHPDDALVRARFNAHQHRDKGFGPALGPTATAVLASLLASRDYTLATSPSDWRAGPGDAAFAEALVEGWVAAALAGGTDVAAPAESGIAPRILAWGDARRAALGRGDLTLRIGHLDALAWRGKVSAR